MEIFQDGELEEAMRKNDSLHATNLTSWWRLFSESYEELIQSITNPVRASYAVSDLGDSTFTVTSAAGGAPFACKRDDLQLVNARNETLACSFWRRCDSVTTTTYDCSSIGSAVDDDDALLLSPAAVAAVRAPPCIVYLHELSSSRKECVYLRDAVLAAGFSLFALDLSGSGLSDGARVSFGYYEQTDVRAALDYLYSTGAASRVGLWGRGVGGAAALLHLRSVESLRYKSLLLTPAQASELTIVEDRATRQLLCVRPSSLRLPFRCTRTDVNNGDFVVLSIGNIPVAGLSAAECMQRICDAPDARLRIAGYAKATAGEPDTFVVGLTMDCTFGDMEQLITDMLVVISASAERRDLVIPSTMLAAVAKIIGRSIRKTGGFSPSDIKLLDDVPRFTYPSLFLCATKKDFITPAHTIALHDAYGGPKQLLQFDGVHEQNRPRDVVERVLQHFASANNVAAARM